MTDTLARDGAAGEYAIGGRPLRRETERFVQGAGEYELSSREVLGFGGTQGYDSTLNGKVLDLAIREAVNRLVEGVEQGKWTPARN